MQDNLRAFKGISLGAILGTLFCVAVFLALVLLSKCGTKEAKLVTVIGKDGTERRLTGTFIRNSSAYLQRQDGSYYKINPNEVRYVP